MNAISPIGRRKPVSHHDDFLPPQRVAITGSPVALLSRQGIEEVSKFEKLGTGERLGILRDEIVATSTKLDSTKRRAGCCNVP